MIILTFAYQCITLIVIIQHWQIGIPTKFTKEGETCKTKFYFILEYTFFTTEILNCRVHFNRKIPKDYRVLSFVRDFKFSKVHDYVHVIDKIDKRQH